MADFKFQDPEELERQAEAARKQKQTLSMIGGLTDAMASGTSFGDAFLGRSGRQSTAGREMAQAMSANIEDPRERQKKLLEDYRSRKQLEKDAKLEQREADLDNAKSSASLSRYALLKKYGLNPELGKTAREYDMMYGDPSTYAQAKYKNRLDIDKTIAEAQAKATLEMNKNPNKLAFDRLPPENQAVITDLSKKNASKLAIANQIDAVSNIMDDPAVPLDQKIMQGEQMLKVLNSTEGADAVGAEEVKRLGSLLRYQMLNLTQPGKVFGRDVEGFKTQVKLTSAGIKKAIQSNQEQIDKLYGGRPIALNIPDTRTIVPPNHSDLQDQTAHAGARPKLREINGVLYEDVGNGLRKVKR